MHWVSVRCQIIHHSFTSHDGDTELVIIYPAVLFLSMTINDIIRGARTLAGMFLATCQPLPKFTRFVSYQLRTLKRRGFTLPTTLPSSLSAVSIV